DDRMWKPYKENASIGIEFNTCNECVMWILNEWEKCPEKYEGYRPELGWNLKYGKYDNSWDWLMPVVEKISKIKMNWEGCEPYYDNVYPRTFGMLDNQGRPMFRFNGHSLFVADTLIESVWLAVVDFIEWYNNQKTTDGQ